MGLNIKVSCEVDTDDNTKIIGGILIDFKYIENDFGKKELMAIVIDEQDRFRLIPYYDITFDG